VRRVAIIGADFVPSSLPPATRIRFFARHLPEFGWDPIILTTDPKYYDWNFDPTNEQLLSPSLKVIRTRAFNSAWTRKIGIGDVGMRSLWYHWRALQSLCRDRQVDLVFIPVPPSVPMVLGRLAHLKFGIPYVIDYIDPWVSEYYWSVPKSERPPKWPLAYAMARVLEPFAIKRVSQITGVSRGTTDSVIRRYSNLTSAHGTEIPYGAEPTDFDYLQRNPRPNSVFDNNDGLFHISYVGACIPGMHPTVRAVFQALRLGIAREPEVFRRLRLHFVGTSYARDLGVARLREIAREVGVAEYVNEITQRVPYLESLQIMLDSSALVLVGSDEPHYTASKVFPCLLARKPLLAVFHKESSVNEILDGSNSALVVNYSGGEPPATQVEAIYTALLKLIHMNVAERTEVEPTGFLSARMMTRRLASTFDHVLGNSERTQAVSPLQETLSK
jgi:hypothetical protein